MKRILSLLLVASSILPMELEQAKPNRLPERLEQPKSYGIWQEHIKPPSVFIPEKFGEMMLYHSDKGFRIYQNDKKYKIDKLFTDARVRNASREELHSFLKNGYLVINRTNTGEFTLRANERLVGGGVIGAAIGAFLGKAAVSVVGHGTILIIGALTGPAAPVTIIALESVFGAAIESASMAGAVAGGVALGVATGPV